jgi:ABC-type transport system involved in multi-copper enzyme maturation permease subunit/regulation of enolase protein 1 (concanavalin A-like superfamily)
MTAGFAWALHAEWTKFRTVRGWVITMIVAVLATVAVGLLQHSGCSFNQSACPAPPDGPGGEAVQDAFHFVHQPLTGNGTITVEMTSLTGVYSANGGVSAAGAPVDTRPGLQAWSKAGIIIKENTTQGSAYAAMMVTGTHGVRMQWDYVNDTPGMTGSVAASSPRWLRLVRDGDTITGYDSADGTHWTPVDTVTLPGLTSTVQAGLFAASPMYSISTSSGIGDGSGTEGPTLATGVFRHVGLSWPGGGWTGTDVGGNGMNGVGLPGSFRQNAGTITVSGSGDIAPASGSTIRDALVGTFAGLIALIVVGAMFITAEYRRGLIRASLAASPRRGRLLAAKAVVLGGVSFIVGLVAALVAIAVDKRILTAYGSPLLPLPTLTVARIIVGTAAMLAVAAVLALAIGTILRRSAAAVATVIAGIFIPYLLAITPNLLPLGAQDWLLRITPAAGFSVQNGLPKYSQVDDSYPLVKGYYPLAPWAGFAVECAWAVAALVLAWYLLRRRDA